MKEDYASFKTAMLLKEKGFDETCYACYEYFESGVTLFKGWPFEYKGKPVHNTNDRIKCPTLQMAMKWLRELGIVITIQTKWPTNPELCKIPYSFLIEDYRPERDLQKEHGKYHTGYSSTAGMDDFLVKNNLLSDGLGFGEFKLYEQACEAA